MATNIVKEEFINIPYNSQYKTLSFNNSITNEQYNVQVTTYNMFTELTYNTNCAYKYTLDKLFDSYTYTLDYISYSYNNIWESFSNYAARNTAYVAYIAYLTDINTGAIDLLNQTVKYLDGESGVTYMSEDIYNIKKSLSYLGKNIDDLYEEHNRYEETFDALNIEHTYIYNKLSYITPIQDKLDLTYNTLNSINTSNIINEKLKKLYYKGYTTYYMISNYINEIIDGYTNYDNDCDFTLSDSISNNDILTVYNYITNLTNSEDIYNIKLNSYIEVYDETYINNRLKYIEDLDPSYKFTYIIDTLGEFSDTFTYDHTFNAENISRLDTDIYNINYKLDDLELKESANENATEVNSSNISVLQANYENLSDKHTEDVNELTIKLNLLSTNINNTLDTLSEKVRLIDLKEDKDTLYDKEILELRQYILDLQTYSKELNTTTANKLLAQITESSNELSHRMSEIENAVDTVEVMDTALIQDMLTDMEWRVKTLTTMVKAVSSNIPGVWTTIRWGENGLTNNIGEIGQEETLQIQQFNEMQVKVNELDTAVADNNNTVANYTYMINNINNAFTDIQSKHSEQLSEAIVRHDSLANTINIIGDIIGVDVYTLVKLNKIYDDGYTTGNEILNHLDELIENSEYDLYFDFNNTDDITELDKSYIKDFINELIGYDKLDEDLKSYITVLADYGNFKMISQVTALQKENENLTKRIAALEKILLNNSSTIISYDDESHE